MQLAGLGVDIAGQDVIQHHVLDEVGLVELLVVVLLDALQADGEQAGKLSGSLVGAFHIHGVIVVLVGAELMVAAAVLDEAVAGQALGHKAVPHLADHVQIGTGNHGAGLIHHTDHPIDGVLHLVDNTLKHSVCHNTLPFYLTVMFSTISFVIFEQLHRLSVYILHKGIYFCNIFQRFFLPFIV